MLPLYALAEHPARLPAVAGIGGSSLAAVEVEGIDAIVSDLGAEPGGVDETILVHARVVEELAALNDAVLPARLTDPFRAEAALLDAIGDRAQALKAALDRVRGCAELGVQVVPRQNGVGPAPGSGSEYMRSRLDAVRSAEGIADELDRAVGEVARDRTRRIAATPELVLTAAYLVPRSEVEPFRAAVESLQRARRDVAYVCVGPW